jgi:hypothetical protein
MSQTNSLHWLYWKLEIWPAENNWYVFPLPTQVFLFFTSYHLTFYSINTASLFFNWFILWLKNDPLDYLELMQMYLSIYFQLSLLLPKLVESTFLRKLHDLSNNEAAPDSTRSSNWLGHSFFLSKHN